jgi:hypothetical protein
VVLPPLTEVAEAWGIKVAYRHVLVLAEALMGQVLDLMPDASKIDYVEARIQDASRLVLSELRASGRTPPHLRNDQSLLCPARAFAGRYACGECRFSAADFEDLQHHVYDVHPGGPV